MYSANRTGKHCNSCSITPQRLSLVHACNLLFVKLYYQKSRAPHQDICCNFGSITSPPKDTDRIPVKGGQEG